MTSNKFKTERCQRKILLENTSIRAHEINKLRLKILEVLLIKTKQKNLN